MKITNKSVIIPGAIIQLNSEEILIIKAVFREPDGIYYRVQFVEEDGDEYVSVDDERIMAHYELVGGEV